MIAAGSQHRDGAHRLQFVAAGDTGQLPRQAEHLQERLHGLKKPGGEPSQAVHQVYQQAERREAYEEVRLGRRSDIRPSQSSNSWSSSPMWSECVSECNLRQNTRTLSRVSPDAYNSNNMRTQLALIVDYLKVSQSTTQ